MNLTKLEVFNPLRNNVKRQQLNKQKKQSIRYENLNLLRKMQFISDRKSSCSQPFKKQSLNIFVRRKNCRKIHEQNIQMAARLSSQSSSYSQQVYRPVISKRSNTLISATKRRNTITSSQFRSIGNHQTNVRQQSIEQNNNLYKKRMLVYHQPVEIHGKLFLIQLSRSESCYFVSMQQIPLVKRYNLKLSEEVGEYIIKLIQDKRFHFTRRIKCINDIFHLRIPFKGVSYQYSFLQLKQSQFLSKRNSVSSKRRINSCYQHKSVDLVFNPYKLTQQTKPFTNVHQMSSQQLLSQSSHSYMYQNRADDFDYP